MSVKRIVSPIWKTPFPNLESLLKDAFSRGMEQGGGPVRVWFRADDIGVPSAGFKAMADVFRTGDIPLAPAVVPAWLTERRWDEVRKQAGDGKWCLHQHGRRHMNHELQGRKCEFGSGRTRADKKRDLLEGMERLRRIMGDAFFPAFTPPWNRFDMETGELLEELGFRVASRDDKAFLRFPGPLPEVMVNCDLHTRSREPEEDRNVLLSEIEYWAGRGLVGFMLHHQRMNARALDFLVVLFRVIRSLPGVEPVSLPDLCGSAGNFLRDAPGAGKAKNAGL